MKQWQEGLDRLLQGESKSAIVAEMYQPELANYINWWVFYQVNSVVYIQNKLLFIENLGCDFLESDLYAYIPERETETDEGDHISEWAVELHDIASFRQESSFT